ncbi:hypothetical protein [Alkaliphilus serpentinus]|uniref:GRAM domain-containing protein n=1 Tax=Alkaliphilus serpentinus TaxID=1482731 RepID=A0A833M993_9FIRM|nr:hypothetical protein [Alkaliphilus serpentinus]KAB3527280.1 hypothetical protein F8153_12510 [Alkaliphilus serpentinus]
MDTIKSISLILAILGLIYLSVNIILRKKAIGVMNKIGKENILLISENANFFGQESVSMQIRGNGTLVLLKDKLYFELLLPKKVIEIPIERIEGIDETRSHLGKSVGSKLVKITYRNDKNSLDSCAWLVRNRKDWMDKIKELIDN